MFSNWLLADFRNRECPNSTSCFARLLRKKPWLYSQFRSNNEVIGARLFEGLAVSVVSTLVAARWQDPSFSLQVLIAGLKPIPGNSFHQLPLKVAFYSRSTDRREDNFREFHKAVFKPGPRYFSTWRILYFLSNHIFVAIFLNFSSTSWGMKIINEIGCSDEASLWTYRVLKSSCRIDLFPMRRNFTRLSHFYVYTELPVSRFNASLKLPEQISRSSVTLVSCKTSRGYRVWSVNSLSCYVVMLGLLSCVLYTYMYI